MKKEAQSRDNQTSRIGGAVTPLLLACCAVVAFSMVLNPAYSNQQTEDTEVQTSESSSPQSFSPGSDEGAMSGSGVSDDVILGSYSAESESVDERRVENLRLAAGSIDGVVIEPGETLSFNATIGDIENDERYQYASTLVGNELVDRRGGGSCQAASALYFAALSAGLHVAERHPHAAFVDFAPAGLDATVAYGVMDLKITNEYEHSVTIKAEAEGQTVHVSVLGQPLEDGLRIEPTAVLRSYHPAGTPVRYEVDWDPGLVDSTYYLVESFLHYYRHGIKTETVVLARDVYMVVGGATVRLPAENQGSTK